MRRHRYNQDPFWMKARYESTCGCGATIRKGDDIFYFPKYRTAECHHCGRKSASLLADEIANETMNAM